MRHAGPCGRRCLRYAPIVLVVLAVCRPVVATNRLVRHFDHRDGLPVAFVSQVAQDAGGFLWIATQGGLVRYDGIEMRPWGREVTIGSIDRVVTGPRGGVVIRVHPSGALLRVAGETLEPILGADQEPLVEVRDMGFSDDGRLWVVGDDELLSWDGDTWTRCGRDRFDGERPWKLGPPLDERTLLITSGGVWTIGDDEPVKILAMGGVVDVQPHPSGSLFVVQSEFPTHLIEVRDGEPIERFTAPDRPVDLVLRDDTIWFSLRRGLVALRPGRPPEPVATQDFADTGGFLCVDREGSLWLANFHGLYQFPEPDTVLSNTGDGLPIEHARFLARSADGLWVSTWSGLALRDSGDGWTALASTPERIARAMPCADSWGRMWTAVALDEGTGARHEGVIERSAGRFAVHEFPGAVAIRCAPAGDGTVWMAAEDRLLRTSPAGGRPSEVARLPLPDGWILSLMEDESGTLWAAGDGTICHAPVTELARVDAWSCESLPEKHQVKAIVPTPSGTVWVGTSGGVFRRSGDTWELVPASRDLPSAWVLNLRASPSGGIWIAGSGALLRVEERPDSVKGWEIVEAPGIWQGIPTGGAEDVLEDPDGTLWLATSAGVVRIPPDARMARPSPPPVELVAVSVDGRRIPMDEETELPHDRNRVELSFAALSYRDPTLIRYQVRPRAKAPWTESRIPAMRFVDLPPGRYRPEVLASLDGVSWSPQPASFPFTVLAPWYRRPWAIAIFVAALAAALHGAYRVRVAVLLRLERQRTRIAMDLHDEMGAGLGSIGLLADLVSDRAIAEDERKDLAAKISTTVDELGASLTDIIWSLHPRSEQIEALSRYLRERARRIIPDTRIRIDAEFPESWPQAALSLAVRRNVQRIAIEALRNAARHSRARRVVVGLAPTARQRWVLSVTDDGRGMPEAPPHREGSGLGLESMRKRAEQIGATIRWIRGPDGGTRVELEFDPGAGEARGHGTA